MNRIKEYRIRAGMTQIELSKALNVSQGTISAYESGRTEPDINTMRKLSLTLDVPIDQIFDISDPQPEQTYKPMTTEARIISAGIDKMPKADREKALTFMRIIFSQYEEYFEEGDDANDPKP